MIYRNGDSYKGQFEKDTMEGRGLYLFNSLEHKSILYIGELKSNAFQGLGSMHFRCGTLYFGSFNNNAMQSQKAILKLAGGDIYKGPVQ